ncbi:MAG: hypothetical protein ABJO86_15540 [Lentilitoribacter sp.]
MKDQKLGILMLDTQFPRILGDAGNPETYAMDVLIHIVENVSSLDVVNDQQLSQEVRQKFIDAAIALEDNGVSAITSTCGFLYKEQTKIADAVDIPVMVSSLSLYAKIKRETGSDKIVILTASSTDLVSLIHSSNEIEKDDVVIIGMENCNAFSQAILQDKNKQSTDLDVEEIANFVKGEVVNSLNMNTDVGAILMECGNLPPYNPAIKTVTDLPVYSILDGVEQIMSR